MTYIQLQQLHEFFTNLHDNLVLLNELDLYDDSSDQQLLVLQERQRKIISEIDSLRTEYQIGTLPDSTQSIVLQCLDLERQFGIKLNAEKNRLENQIQMVVSGRKMRNSYQAEESNYSESYFIDKLR